MKNLPKKFSIDNDEEERLKKEKNAKTLLIVKKVILMMTAGLMDAYAKLLSALIFWDKSFLEKEWLFPIIWRYEEKENKK